MIDTVDKEIYFPRIFNKHTLPEYKERIANAIIESMRRGKIRVQ